MLYLFNKNNLHILKLILVRVYYFHHLTLNVCHKIILLVKYPNREVLSIYCIFVKNVYLI